MTTCTKPTAKKIKASWIFYRNR